MALRRWLVRGFWWLDAVLGGDAEPGRSQIFAARHPVKTGVRVGAAMGALFAVLGVLSPGAWSWGEVGIPCAVIVFFGVFMTGVGFWERRRQRHYGFYEEARRTELGG
ncbi:hypothetical protein [Streptosporangium sandarakinum]|uniref:Uncharacterized protein n=1 Tax=Streptosporangium sandarakinum TaxID=1260955 RepID=A0A852V0X7_9ACTN|nr:hypothetical protein [Streptosporangium sandarakinum]NYF40924.1 hypothetical protein [Streptosporangium sandarakinum]